MSHESDESKNESVLTQQIICDIIFYQNQISMIFLLFFLNLVLF